jgi:hypothetical protein
MLRSNVQMLVQKENSNLVFGLFWVGLPPFKGTYMENHLQNMSNINLLDLNNLHDSINPKKTHKHDSIINNA